MASRSRDARVLYARVTDAALERRIDRFVALNDLTYTEFVLLAAEAYMDAREQIEAAPTEGAS